MFSIEAIGRIRAEDRRLARESRLLAERSRDILIWSRSLVTVATVHKGEKTPPAQPPSAEDKPD
jgi:hypothetical protein